MHRLAELPPSVRAYLSDFVKRWRRVVTLRAAGAALAVIAVWALVACTADRLLHLPGPVRLASLAIATFTAMAVGIALLRRIRGPVNWVTMAGIIEEHDPRFDQALITVTSRVLGSPEHRGSDEILSHLLRDVERRAADGAQRKILTLRSAAGPWIILLAATAAIAGLSRITDLGGPRLLARLIAPLADLPPVTTTELDVEPRGAEIMQSDQFRIEVHARRLGSNSVLILINDEGDNWTQYPMDDAGSGRFTYTIKTVGHDFHYKLRGGDAESPPFAVRVKRPPAVAEFRIRYTYPPYAGKAPFTVTNTTGTIEAPAGSDVLLTIVATEPLQSAVMRAGEKVLLMEKTAEENVRQTALHFERDTPYEVHYELDLISTREVKGSGPSRMVLRSTADRPPAVRLQEGGQILRLNRHDILPLSYQAVDDYGVVAMSLLAQINGDRLVQFPLHLSAARRRVEDTLNFDLALLELKIGDVVTLTVSARDTADKDASSDALRVLVSPLSIDLDAHERIDGLAAAANFAASLVEDTAAGAKAIDEVQSQGNHPSAASLAADASASRSLTSASEAATLLKQALLRVQAHSRSAELSVAISNWLDVAQQQAQTADDLFSRAGLPDGMGSGARQRLRDANARAQDLLMQVQTVARGERAVAVMLDRMNIKDARSAAPAGISKATDALAPVIEQAGEELKRNAAELGVDLTSPDAAQQLGARVEAARKVLRSKQPIDFVAQVHERARELQRDPRQRAGMQLRLATAAQAEAVRKDADMIRACDLELAARAAGAIEVLGSPPPAGKQSVAAGLNALAVAIAVVQREEALGHAPLTGRAVEEARTIRLAATKARDEMARWAGEIYPPKITATPARSGELEPIAMSALYINEVSIRREYKRAGDEDRQLTQKLSDAARKPGGRAIEGAASSAAAQVVEDRQQRVQQASDAIARQMTAAETIEKLGLSQERMAVDLRAAKPLARELSVRQRTLADQIATIERQQQQAAFPTTAPVFDAGAGNFRERALAAVMGTQEELTATRDRLATAQEADAARRKTAERAGAARHDVAIAPPQRLRHANRAADQADQDARDAADEFDRSIAPLMPQMASELSDRLEPFAQETSDARDDMSGPLSAALADFAVACDGNDADAVARAADDVRIAIDATMKDLSVIRKTIAERDPLMAARLFARAASDSLGRRPPDLRGAISYQASTSLALTQAWESAIHRAAEIRLSELPSLQAVYGPPPPGLRDTNIANASSPNLGSHDWPRLHAKGDDLTATMKNSDAPGYEDQIRLYFQAMGKAQEKK